MSYDAEMPQEVLAEDKIISVRPIAFDADNVKIVKADDVFN